MTYGDGVSDVNITASIAFHKKHGKRVTMTSVQPPARFGALSLEENRSPPSRRNPPARAAGSTEASLSCTPKSIDDSHGRRQMFEREPMETWSPKARFMPTSITGSGRPWTRCATRPALEELWSSGKAQWKTW